MFRLVPYISVVCVVHVTLVITSVVATSPQSRRQLCDRKVALAPRARKASCAVEFSESDGNEVIFDDTIASLVVYGTRSA